MRFGLIEIVTIIAAIGIVAAVVIPRLSQGTERHELPPAIQDLQDKGADFIYNESTGRIHLLNSDPKTEEEASGGWVSPVGGTGFMIRNGVVIVIGEQIHSPSWYCFEGIDGVFFDETQGSYVCGE